MPDRPPFITLSGPFRTTRYTKWDCIDLEVGSTRASGSDGNDKEVSGRRLRRAVQRTN